MRIPRLLAVTSLALLFTAPILSAQAVAEKALTTAATPAPTLAMPHVNIPRATVPSTTVHRYAAQPTTTPRIAARPRSTTTSHKSTHTTGSNPRHVTYRRVQ
jgi:hypothetical protein